MADFFEYVVNAATLRALRAIASTDDLTPVSELDRPSSRATLIRVARRLSRGGFVHYSEGEDGAWLRKSSTFPAWIRPLRPTNVISPLVLKRYRIEATFAPFEVLPARERRAGRRMVPAVYVEGEVGDPLSVRADLLVALLHRQPKLALVLAQSAPAAELPAIRHTIHAHRAFNLAWKAGVAQQLHMRRGRTYKRMKRYHRRSV